MQTILVTGSNGLIGSSIVESFCSCKEYSVVGIDNDQRKEYFGLMGSTQYNGQYLKSIYANYSCALVDIRDHEKVDQMIREIKPDLVIHCAAQPSHEKASEMILDDFNINALATLNLIKSVANHCAEAPFIFMSTNKVYGDNPNEINYEEKEKRYDYTSTSPYCIKGIDENMSIDQSVHSFFGTSKLAADIIVQEYGRNYSMATCCLRAGCITGSKHAGVENHGFLNYLISCYKENREYQIYGYKGKQVRDNLDAYDITNFVRLFAEKPKCGVVYNIGGAYENSISILEAIELIETIGSRKMKYKHHDLGRKGDHRVYYSDLTKLQTDYPEWKVTRNLETIFLDIYQSERPRVIM